MDLPMPHGNRKTPPFEEAARLPSNLTISDLAERFDVTYHTARKWAASSGYQYKRGYFTYRTGDQVEELLKILKDNSDQTLSFVGKILGVTRQRVHQLYEVYGVPRVKKPLMASYNLNIGKKIK